MDKVPELKVTDKPVTGDGYYSHDFMEQEWGQMWTKTWLIAGLEEQLPNAGDRITCEIGKEPILCT